MPDYADPIQHYQKRWLDADYLNNCLVVADAIDRYLARPITRILDIGCGFAETSRILQQRHGCELWLLEGDFTSTESRERPSGYGETETMKFYTGIDRLRAQWDAQGMQYTFVDANDIQIPNDVKFDLVTSHLSCGFHYPVSTYADLIKTHSTPDCAVAMNIRRKTYDRRTDADRWRPRARIHGDQYGKHSLVDLEIL